MASQPSDEAVGHYENVTRLADKKAVTYSEISGLHMQLHSGAEGSLTLVSDVLGLGSDVITNHDPLPEPERYGAGGVRKFASKDKNSFLKKPVEVGQDALRSMVWSERGESVSDEEMARRIQESEQANTTTGQSSTVSAGFSQLLDTEISRQGVFNLAPEDGTDVFSSHGSGDGAALEASEAGESQNTPLESGNGAASAQEWPYFETALDFHLPTETVKQRAAWAWYRTAIICAKAARSLKQKGQGQMPRDLGLDLLASDSISHARFVLEQSAESLRQKGARARAHALLLFPELLGSDDIQRPSWGQGFTEEDFEYYREMSVNHEIEERYHVGQAGRELQTQQDALVAGIKESGGILKLWAKAAKWGTSPATPARWRDDFRTWWLRAANAKGHGVWLRTELTQDYCSIAPHHAAPVEAWRLRMPGFPSSYRNDCVVACCVHISYKDDPMSDEYNTPYNVVRCNLDEIAHHLSGEIRGASVYGAPAFVYSEYARTGWTEKYFGAFPDMLQRGYSTYWQRYARKGLADHLPPDACEYDRSLAVCVDDIFAEFLVWAATHKMQGSQIQETANDIWDGLGNALNRILRKRQVMTKSQADTHNFKGAAINAIQEALEVFRAFLQPTDVWDPTLLAGLERKLDSILGAWFRVLVYHPGLQTQSGLSLPVVVLQEHCSPRIPPEIRGMDPVAKVMDYVACFPINEKLEEVRQMILNGRHMTDEEVDFARCFRGYLETGKEMNMPRLAHGTLRGRDLTFLEHQRSSSSKCPEGCPCVPNRERELQFRKSDSADAVENRNKIRRFFREGANSSRPRDRDASAAVTSALQTSQRANGGRSVNLEKLKAMGFSGARSSFALEMTEDVHSAAQLLLQMDDDDTVPSAAGSADENLVTGDSEACEDEPDNCIGKGKAPALLKPSGGIDSEIPQPKKPVTISERLQDTDLSAAEASSSKAVASAEDKGYEDRKRQLLKDTATALKKQNEEAKKQRQQILDRIKADRERRLQKSNTEESSHQDAANLPAKTVSEQKWERKGVHSEAKLRLQTPDSVFQRTFLPHHTLAEVAAFINEEAGIVTARFETSLPLRQVFLPDSFQRTLAEVGMVPSAAVRVVPAMAELQEVSA